MLLLSVNLSAGSRENHTIEKSFVRVSASYNFFLKVQKTGPAKILDHLDHSLLIDRILKLERFFIEIFFYLNIPNIRNNRSLFP